MSDAPRTDLSGRKIGEYDITARIGVGGMGEVYEGRQPLIGKRVAVKVLLPSLSNEKELVERFLAEARAVNEIRHRGIVDIFSFGQLPEGAHYFVMEFLDGQAFDRILKQRGPLPVGEAHSYIEEVLDARTQFALVYSIVGVPNGVIAMSFAVPGLVETSTNLASVKYY